MRPSREPFFVAGVFEGGRAATIGPGRSEANNRFGVGLPAEWADVPTKSTARELQHRYPIAGNYYRKVTSH